MKVILINKRHAAIALFFILAAISLCFLSLLEWKYDIGTAKLEESSVVAFTSANSINKEIKNIEIFDIGLERVIKTVQPDPRIFAESRKLLNSLSGMYEKVNAFPKKGYIVRVPFECPERIDNEFLMTYEINPVNEFFILYPDTGNPYLLVLDKKNRPYFFYFSGNSNNLLKLLDFEMK